MSYLSYLKPTAPPVVTKMGARSAKPASARAESRVFCGWPDTAQIALDRRIAGTAPDMDTGRRQEMIQGLTRTYVRFMIAEKTEEG